MEPQTIKREDVEEEEEVMVVEVEVEEQGHRSQERRDQASDIKLLQMKDGAG